VDSHSASARFLPIPMEADVPGRTRGHVRVQNSVYGDEDLVIRLQEGDRDALSHLFKSYARPIRTLGIRILHSPAEADDLVQEVFLYIYRKSSLFDGSKGSARSWIFQIAYTQAFLRRRKLKANGIYLSPIPDNQRRAPSSCDSYAEYDHTVEGLFGQNGWRQAMEALSEEQRETLRLHFFEGYSFAEIADKLGQSYANIRNHYYRGLEKLRKHLASDQLSKR